MARDRDPFSEALHRLRNDLRDGKLRPGEVLSTAAIAGSLRVSATPVREAISRLAGEGLLEDHRGRGACALRYTAADVEELYALHEAYVGLAISLAQLRPAGARTSPFLPADGSALMLRAQTEQLWGLLVRAADGEALIRVHQNLSDQLAVLRLAEPSVLGNMWTELSTLTGLIHSLDFIAFAAASKAYHHRRAASSRDIAAALRKRAN